MPLMISDDEDMSSGRFCAKEENDLDERQEIKIGFSDFRSEYGKRVTEIQGESGTV
jgi:hypothetical protein